MSAYKRKFGVIAAVLLFVFAVMSPRGGFVNATADTGATDGKIAYYAFDGDAPLGDSVSGRKASLRGGGVIGANGRSDGYALLDGNSSYIELPSETVASLTEFTFSAWVHLDSSAAVWTRYLEMAGYDNGTPQTYISLCNRASGMSIAVTRNGVGSQIVYEYNATLVTGGWAHLALTADSAGKYALYINGALAGEANIGVNISQVRIDNIYIGKSAYASDPYLAAYIDDICIYGRALSKDEIASASGVTDESAVLADAAAVDIPTELDTTKIKMPSQGDNGTAIAWTSSDERIISLSGNVLAVSENTAVTLSAVFTRGNVTLKKTYEVTVKPLAAHFTAYNTDAAAVTLLPYGEIHEMKNLNKEYMLSLEIDRLLCNYRKTSGIITSAQEYGGWITEENGGAGNIEAHYLSALVYLYAEEKDPIIGARIDEYLTIWKQCQTAYARLYPEREGYFGGVDFEKAIASIEQYGSGWPLYYVIDKHLCALYDAYVYLSKAEALDILRPFADFIADRINGYDEATMQRVLKVEYGGISMALFKAYSLIPDNRYLAAALRFCEPSVYDTIEAGGDPFDWKHSNTAIPKIFGAAWGYTVTGDERYLRIAVRGFDVLTEGRTFVTGNVSEVEEFHPAHEIDTEGFQSCETCCAYNLMRLSDILYRFTGEKAYMDYYERLFYNCILSSIDPVTGMKTYYVSMDSGYYKVYHTAETSFWCCTGTGFENFTKLNQNIYYNTEDSLTVNLFVPSRIEDSHTGITLEQTTDYPNVPVTTLTVQKGANTAIRIRNPYWSAGTEVSFNGKLIEPETDEYGYIVLRRDFAAGDTIKVHFPMTFRLEALDSVTQAPVSAIMYGPLVMSGIIESIGEISPIQNNALTENTTDNKVKDELFYSGESLFDDVKKIGDLEYLLTADNQTVRIKAFYKCHRERYTLYWNIARGGSEEFTAYINRENAEESYCLDSIDCGNWFSESAHAMLNSGSWVGNYATEHNRGLENGGWFSYVMKAERGVKNNLEIMHFGTDADYSYSVWFNNVKAATVVVAAQGKKFYWQTVPIPESVTKNADRVTVKIVCESGTLTTGIYTMRTVREGLKELRRSACELSAGESESIVTAGNLTDCIEATGSGKIRIEGIRDGKENVLIYEGGAPITVRAFNTFDSIKATALESFAGEIAVYGDEVASVDPIAYTLAAKGDMYAPEQFATVRLVSCGSVRLRVNYEDLTFVGGTATAGLYGTELTVSVSVGVKSATEGLSVYYDFEDCANGAITDKSGNGNTGTAYGGVTAARGKFGNGLDLGGIDGYVQVPAVSVGDEFTLGMWVKFNNTQSLLYQRLFDFGNDRKNYFAYAVCGYAAGADNGTLYTVSDKVYEFAADAWYHYAVTVKNNVAVTYLNGVELSRSTVFDFDLSDMGGYIANYIGKAHIDYTPYLNAVVDEFRMYDYALSRDQIKGLYRMSDSSSEYFASADDTYEIIEEEKIDITYQTPQEGGDTQAKSESGCGGCEGCSSAFAVGAALGAGVLLKKKLR